MKRDLYIQIKEFLRDVIRGTEFEGHVMAVGGCVRDDLMQQLTTNREQSSLLELPRCEGNRQNVNEIKDIDMCVSLPRGGIRFAEWLRDNGYTLKGVTVYPNYGTAMLHLKAFPDVELEFVQTRKEKYIDHSCRNPETAFGTIKDDCMRRDLTINALYCNLSTDEIIDITGNGVNDIRDHIIRTPADPDLTYDDDPLRILRCIRFASRYGWDVDKNTFDGMVRNVFRLEIITKERIRDEFCKMLTCKHPLQALRLLLETGAMQYVIPELEAIDEVVVQTIEIVQQFKDEDKIVLMLAAMLHKEKDSKNVETILQTLKFTNKEIAEVCFLTSHIDNTKDWGTAVSDKELRKLQYICKTEERFSRLMMLLNADNMFHGMHEQVPMILARTEQMKSEGTAMFGFKGFLSGNEVMKIKGLKTGPQVKECLDYLLKLAFSEPLMEKERVIKNLLGYRIK